MERIKLIFLMFAYLGVCLRVCQYCPIKLDTTSRPIDPTGPFQTGFGSLDPGSTTMDPMTIENRPLNIEDLVKDQIAFQVCNSCNLTPLFGISGTLDIPTSIYKV